MHQSKLLVAVSLLLTPCASTFDRKHKRPMARHSRGQFVAFAYTSSNLTAEGSKPVAGTTIAADTRVLPFGTRVRISDAGPWSGEYRVGDVGGNIKGNKIDVFVPSRAEAIEFGRRNIVLTVLELPKRNASSEGTRARRADQPCVKCERSTSEAMMAKNDSRGRKLSSGSRPDAAGRPADSSQSGDQGESRGSATLSDMSAVEGTSAH
ncbi:MAG TPA: 3D domain-containing protein [Bryobacteraceae bacterium]|nr:3D domain-containing protein [Bryobacteraceae bacterium]